VNLGDAGLQNDIEILKPNENTEIDSANNMLFWHVGQLHEKESAVLSFSSPSLQTDEMFPLEVKFHEQYSALAMEMVGQPKDALTGEDLSQKLSVSLKAEGYKITSD